MDIQAIDLWLAKLQFNLDKRTMIYQKVAAFSKQGTPVFNTISMFADAYAEKRGDARALVLKEWISAMIAGASFSQSLVGYAPDSEVMLIAAGEANGDLEGGMNKAIFVTKSISEIRSSLIGGLSYSGILILTLIAMIVMFSIKIIPEMVTLLPPEKWPAISQRLYAMSQFVTEYGFWLIGGTIVCLTVCFQTLGYFKGPVRKWCDYLPPWSIYKVVQSSVFLITLSSMMSAGIPFHTALEKIKTLSPPYIADYIDDMINLLIGGSENGDALDVNLFDYDTALDVRLLGRTADFQSSLLMLGEQSVSETIKKVNVITQAIGTVVLFLITGFVIFIYLGFYTLTQSISQNAS